MNIEGLVTVYGKMIISWLYFRGEKMNDENVLLAAKDYAVETILSENRLLKKKNEELKAENEKLQLLLDVQNFLIEPKNKEKKEQLKQNGWVEITMPCSKEDAKDCLTKQEGLCDSTDGLCRIKINLSRLCGC